MFLEYLSSPIIKGCWGATSGMLICSITHSKCWSDGNAARISTSFRNPCRPHTGPSLEERNKNMQHFLHAQKQQTLWIFKFFPCSPKCRLSLQPLEAAVPHNLQQGFLLWSPKAKVKQSRTACTEAAIPAFATLLLLFARLISLVLDSCISVLSLFFFPPQVFHFKYYNIDNGDEKLAIQTNFRSTFYCSLKHKLNSVLQLQHLSLRC